MSPANDAGLVRFVRMRFQPGKQKEAEALADEMVRRVRPLTGCRGVTFFGDAASGEYHLCVFWATQQDADAAAQVISPFFMKALQGNVAEPPDIALLPALRTKL